MRMQLYCKNQVDIQAKFFKKTGIALVFRRFGVSLYREILGVSNVSVLNWIRDFGRQIKELNSESQQIEVVEVDEMHSYIGQKKTSVGYGLLLIDMGKDSSISLLATEAIKQRKSFEKR